MAKMGNKEKITGSNQGGELPAWPVAAATSITFGIASVLCAFFVWLSPVAAINFFNNIFHGIDLAKIMKSNMGLPSFLLGLVEVMAAGALLGWIFVSVYNACRRHCKSRRWVK
ncbi:hypothetical protein HYV84_08270 [Candidatus Woesearchaeota archaeon]|nr:hypothetical protein [Candidatus Woesearchaeota archaeon]